MKNTLTTIIIFLSLILSGQSNMNTQLSDLFLNLDLTSKHPKNMVNKSSLTFEYGVNRGINFRDENGYIKENNTSSYVANFTKNSLIDSKIKEGLISIIQKDDEVQLGTFIVNERVWLHSYEDMIKEYNKLCSSFEKLGYRVKNTIVESENFEIKSESTIIKMENDSKKLTLTIGYYLPSKDEENKEYLLTILYSNY